ncbi:MAG: hypothetical protein COA50_07845 [Flavobacteriaceae bacterium]|nr:MAG: hypothetical protein COA50_07845 [Flavobacteriaceae bacterium]
MMKESKNIKSLILVVLLSVSWIFAQEGGLEEVKDLEAWSTIGLEYKLNKKWSFGLEEQLRLKTDVSEIDKYFTQFEAKYKAFDNLEFGGGVRYLRENDTKGNIQGYENHFRFQLDMSYKHKINDFSLKYRLRYQNKNELGISTSDADYAKQHIRFKTSIGYNIKEWKLDPKFSAELFNHFEEGEDNGLNKYRLTLGTDYKIKKVGKIGFFYRMEKELRVDIPRTTNIIGLKFIHTIKKSI